MSRRSLSPVALLAALAAAAGVVRADPPTERRPPGAAAGDAAEASDGDEVGAAAAAMPPLAGPPQAAPTRGTQVPEAFRAIEVRDLTFGLRDDHFSSLEVAADGSLHVGTYEGRAFISRDGGETWTESTVIPEVKSLYGFAGQGMFLGSLPDRRARGHLPPPLPYPRVEAPASYTLLGGNIDGARGELDLPFNRWAGGLAVTGPMRLDARGARNTAIEGFTEDEAGDASGAGEAVLGVGLSNRAPRLSLLLGVRGRTVPNISLDRLLITTIQRPTEVRRIVAHPTDARRLFAATRAGLYETRDGGVSWVRTYPGAIAAERGVYEVVFDPKDHRRVYLATERGMFQSDDGGSSWVKNAAVPDLWLRRIVIDPNDSRYVYVAGGGGMYRSNDRARSFTQAYFSTQGRLNDVQWMVLDPFDRDRLYLATSDGIVVTDKARESRVHDFRMPSSLRTQGLATKSLRVCTRHRGHVYATTLAALPWINYDANGPEALVLESWDGGQTFRELVGNRTAGDVQWIAPDPRDPDVIYVAFSRALVRVGRAGADPGEPEDDYLTTAIAGPPLTDVLTAALAHHEIDLGSYQRNLDRLRWRAWIPARLTVNFTAGRLRQEGDLDDNQFAADRLLTTQELGVWTMMAWASWRLPSLVYNHDAVAMQRTRVLKMNDEVRNRVMMAVTRNYGELQRIKVRQRTARDRPLVQRVNDRVRIEQLEAVVDLVSGGYLTQRKRKESP